MTKKPRSGASSKVNKKNTWKGKPRDGKDKVVSMLRRIERRESRKSG